MELSLSVNAKDDTEIDCSKTDGFRYVAVFHPDRLAHTCGPASIGKNELASGAYVLVLLFLKQAHPEFRPPIYNHFGGLFVQCSKSRSPEYRNI
ncbi:hypothetical protein [Robbsia andropogonis]|uniref:hypothetical protein n=1 Tax=Robbsia andropogonis TaxID=28092 RepID=UPI000467C98E|nr:hypothetical protein [Robbsia andropogonis]